MHNLNTGWCLPLGKKKQLYGPLRVAVGGASDAGDAPALLGTGRTDDKVEPVAWHQASSVLSRELIRAETYASVVIDWTPMDIMPTLCLELGIPYLGVCYTAKKKEFLYERLASVVFYLMHTEGSNIYKPELARVLSLAKTEAPGPHVEASPKDEDPKPKPPQKRKAGKAVEEPDMDEKPLGSCVCALSALRKRKLADSLRAQLEKRKQESSGVAAE